MPPSVTDDPTARGSATRITCITPAGDYDVDALAAHRPDVLRDVVRVDSRGRRYVDMRTRDGAFAVTTAALSLQHGIAWCLPAGHLCPPVPNRMRYLQWVHALLAADAARPHSGTANVRGIDIGTGASLIYPLLGHSMFSWHFVGSDTDLASVDHARGLVRDNGLADAIDVLHVSGATVVADVVRKGCPGQFDFVMCNPPFFESDGDGAAGGKRAGDGERCPANPSKRRRTKTVGRGVAYIGDITASENECVGGEVAFVGRLLDESYALPKDTVRWFTVMFGRKASVKQFRARLAGEDQGSITYRTTEFTLGRTTRWLVAWRIIVPRAPTVANIDGHCGEADVEGPCSTPKSLASCPPTPLGSCPSTPPSAVGSTPPASPCSASA